MSRVFVVLLIFAAAALIHPPLRRWVQPHTETLLRPAYRQYASWRLEEITRHLENQLESGRPPPGRNTFTPYLERALLSESGARDPWGTPYYLKPEPFSVRVGSAGPDRKLGTDDDLLGRKIGTGKLHFPDR